MKPDVTRVGHVVFYGTDLEKARRFYVDLLGLDIVLADENALYLRGYEDLEWTIKVERGPSPGVRRTAFKVASDGDLDRIIDLAKDRDLPWREEEDYGIERLVRMQDPFGLPMAFYARCKKHERLVQRYDLYRGPAIQRIDHFNYMVPDVQAVHDFYTQVLGFRPTEYTFDDDERMWAAWMHRKGNVHDLALTNGKGPRLHHVGVWVGDMVGLIRAADILGGAGEIDRIERGPGRHGISNAMFLYTLDYDGNRVEIYTSDYITVDADLEPIRWHLNDKRRQTLWGAAAPRSWFEEASQLEDLNGGFVATTESVLASKPQHVIDPV
jgi:catechol 2,3-dioxygenase